MRCATLGVMVLGLFVHLADGQPLPSPSTGAAATDQEALLSGVRAFRAERYAEALDIFRRVETQQQPKDIGFYLGMVLHKLGRHVEALTAFRAAQRSGLREPVADYYHAVSCYRLGMLQRARQGFAILVAPAGPTEQQPVLGPRLQLGAQRFLQAIEQAAAEPDAGSSRPSAVLRRYESALQKAEGLLAPGGSAELALEWFDEAVELLRQVPERTGPLLALRKILLPMREAVRGTPAEGEVLALWARVSMGNAQ